MFNKRHIVRTIAATVSILALSFTAACGSGQSTASNSTDSDDITQQTYKPGKLTIATGQPAYEPWVMNDKPESGEGYEAAVAYAVADKLGFKKSDVVWTRTAFDTAIAPGAKDWDFNIQQFGITHIHLGDAKLIGIRMLRTLNNFADNDIRKLTGYGINTVNFQTSHGDLLSQFMAGKRGLDPLIYPGFTEFHYVAPILT